MTEERKLVTVLFADIVGSTEIGLGHDPEVVRATLGRTFEAVREVLVAHGGTVEKFIGDAVMAVFGVPAAHEDDADRAVRAAFALRERAGALGGPIPLAMRVGVNTGEAVAGSGASAQLLVTGTPVIAAGRLQMAAAPGEILVGALTQLLTRGGVRYGARREVAAKGLGPLEAWPALALETALPETHRGLGPLRAPLIGRDRELRLLEDAFARVRSEAAPALVTIFGPAGAGKSRLAVELVGRIGRERCASAARSRTAAASPPIRCSSSSARSAGSSPPTTVRAPSASLRAARLPSSTIPPRRRPSPHVSPWRSASPRRARRCRRSPIPPWPRSFATACGASSSAGLRASRWRSSSRTSSGPSPRSSSSSSTSPNLPGRRSSSSASPVRTSATRIRTSARRRRTPPSSPSHRSLPTTPGTSSRSSSRSRRCRSRCPPRSSSAPRAIRCTSRSSCASSSRLAASRSAMDAGKPPVRSSAWKSRRRSSAW